MGLLLITHDMGVVARMADRVAVMYAGRIVEEGTVHQVFANANHPYTKGLMSCIPVPGKIKRGDPLGTIPGIVPSLVGDFSGCRFRTRCPFSEDICAIEEPNLIHKDLDKRHSSACHIDQ